MSEKTITGSKIGKTSQSYKSKKASQSGQAIIEYILGISLVLGIVMAVLYPIMRTQFTAMQDNLLAKASVVVAQDQLGIPIEWFFGSNDGSFSAADRALNSSGQGNGGGGPAGGGPGGGGSGPASDSPGGNDGPSGDAGGNPQNSNSASNTRNNSRRSGGSNSSSEDAEETEEKSKDSKNSSSSSGSSSSGSESEDPQNLSTTGEEGSSEDKSKEESGLEGGVKKKDSSKGSGTRGGGCSNMNIFTLLKIAAILLILFLIGAVALSGKGNRDKS